MGVTVALAFFVEDAVEDLSHTDVETKTRYKELKAEDLVVDSNDLETSAVADAYILPEDFQLSVLAQTIRSECTDMGIYQLLVFLVDTEDAEIEPSFLEGIAYNIMDAMDAGDLRLINHAVISMYAFEYQNLM